MTAKRACLTEREKADMLRAQGWRCGCGCGCPVWPGGPVEYDHGVPLGLCGNSKPDQALTPHCHREKTRKDVAQIAKAVRQGRYHRGEKKRKGRKLQGQGFQSKPEGYEYNWPKRRLPSRPMRREARR